MVLRFFVLLFWGITLLKYLNEEYLQQAGSDIVITR